jgi:glutamate synthase domain-containing protein 2
MNVLIGSIVLISLRCYYTHEHHCDKTHCEVQTKYPLLNGMIVIIHQINIISAITIARTSLFKHASK